MSNPKVNASAVKATADGLGTQASVTPVQE